MNNKIIKCFSFLLLGIFLLIYFFGNNIFGDKLTIKRDLTVAQIERFEEDIKNGVKIDINDYIVKDKSYDNIITRTNKKISMMIDQGFKKLFKYLLKNIDV